MVTKSWKINWKRNSKLHIMSTKSKYAEESTHPSLGEGVGSLDFNIAWFCGSIFGKVFLLLVESFSKWIEVIPLNSNYNGTKPTVEVLRIIFATHGLQKICVTDNGPSLTSAEFKHFMSKNGIRHITSAPYHPVDKRIRQASCTIL